MEKLGTSSVKIMDLKTRTSNYSEIDWGKQPSVHVNIRHLNQARYTVCSGDKIRLFMLHFFSLFLVMTVIHLKIRQTEIEEKVNLLSSQLDIILKIVVGHDVLENAHDIKSLFASSHEIQSTSLSKKANLIRQTTTTIDSPVTVNEINNNWSRININLDLVKSSRNKRLNISSDTSVYNSTKNIVAHSENSFVDKNVENSSSENPRSASNITPKKRSFQVKSKVPYGHWLRNISYFEDWKTKHNESASEDNVLSRVTRSNRRKGKKNRRRPPQSERKRHSKKSGDCGPASLHLKGGVPERTFQDGGIIAPWFEDKLMSGSFPSIQFEQNDEGLLEISEAGMYLIYAQVYYLTTELHNSFAINVMEGGKMQKLVALCSANSCAKEPGTLAEVSCFTSVVRFLNASDQVFVLQRERNRHILMRDGQTFLGLVKLNSVYSKK